MLTTCLMNAGSCRRRPALAPQWKTGEVGSMDPGQLPRFASPHQKYHESPSNMTNVAKLCLIHKIAGTMFLKAHLPTGYTCLSPKATVAKARPAAIFELPCSSFAKSGWLSGCSNVGINDQQWCTANGSCRVPRLQDAAARE